MTLEHRNGRTYYYRYVREGEKVRKEYIGAGPIAELAAEADRIEREVVEAERARQRRELERLQDHARPVLEIAHAAEVLARAELVASGYHRRKGEWRRARAHPSDA
jgi:hypothetical protein